MKQIPLGTTGLMVSELCLGTMTWGSQNSQAEAHAQMDMALSRGVTFWDTAEMYPVNPVRAETVGRSEEIIGSWLAARGGRDGLVLATKVTGEGQAAVVATVCERLGWKMGRFWRVDDTRQAMTIATQWVKPGSSLLLQAADLP